MEAFLTFAERVGVTGAILLLVALGLLRLASRLTARHIGFIDQLQANDAKRLKLDKRNARSLRASAISNRRLTNLLEAHEEAQRERHATLERRLDPTPKENGATAPARQPRQA